MSPISTRTDPGSGWRIDDAIVQLREWGTELTYELPATTFIERTIGSAADCDIQLQDDRGISRLHARLVREGALWSIHDVDSKNGIWIDGVRRRSSPLVPGIELGIGTVALIAESDDLLALRRWLSRLLGWSPERRVDVDRALRSVRDAAMLRAALVLCGDGDLFAIASRLHRETLGEARPFVGTGAEAAMPALARAAGGTLCISAKSPPADLEQVIAATRLPRSRVRLVVCSPTIKAAGVVSLQIGRVVRVQITPLEDRRSEITRIIVECAEEAAAAFGQPTTGLDARDLLETQPFDGFADLEESTRRLVAIRTLGITEGAAKLGITHGALSRWAQRRSISS